ncbi:MAG: methyltransferase domain-containing protein [Candidatus Eisenbacteria bacterium]
MDKPVAEELESGAFILCTECGLQYVGPTVADQPVFQDFTEAGQALFSSLETEGAVAKVLTPNERAALEWIGHALAPGASVLELCCESGRFLLGLKSRGLEPIGMDPLAGHVEMLRRRGFAVKQGWVESYPGDWPRPAAVVLLESLVRFPEPIGLLEGIRRRFPRAPIYLSVPSPRRSLKVPEFDRRLDYPPNHLTRWTPRALLGALEHAGYRGKCRTCHIRIKWREGSLRKRLLKAAFAASLRLAGESEYSICATGWPQ